MFDVSIDVRSNPVPRPWPDTEPGIAALNKAEGSRVEEDS
jgi:hypothetical protein